MTLRSHLALTILVALVAAGCASAGRPGEVSVLGTVREVLRDGHTEARADLGAMRGDASLYAVGALAGLEGEYTIDAGELWVSRPRDGTVETRRGLAAAGDAAMVLSAHVDAWTAHTVAKDVDPSEMADYVRAVAAEQGLDPAQPFPFVVDGTFAHLESHVIAGDCPMRARMLGRPADPPPYALSRRSVSGRMVGFYAEGREGEITHHGSHIHAHVLLDDGTPVTAHVESVGLGKGAVLRLPAR